MTDIRRAIEDAFANLLEQDDVHILEEEGEIHIAADEWTLMLMGDPVTAAIVALDHEDGDPTVLIEASLGDADIRALRSLNDSLEGRVIGSLRRTPDPISQALAELLSR